MSDNLQEIMNEMGAKAAAASRELGTASSAQKDKALLAAAAELRAQAATILSANAKDMTLAQEKGLNNARLDRIALDEARLEGIAKALEDVVALPDPVGDVMANWDRPNGLDITRVRVPLG